MARVRLASVLGADALAYFDRVVPGAGVLLAGLLYAVAHYRHPLRPITELSRSGWFNWFDADKYRKAALAWTHFDLRASEYWYPPGYPILGALGHALTPVQPFFVPNALALMISAWLFALLAAEVLGRRPGARTLGALVFLATTVLNASALEVWITPWTTTPATPAIYGCLLAGMRFAARPRPLSCFLAGLVGSTIVLFRPTEAAMILFAVGLAMAWSLVRRPVPPRRFGWIVSAGLIGTALPVAAFVAGEHATGGFGPSSYFALSRLYGFEWRLIPLHWVEILGDPRPLWPGDRGMAGAFPWIVPGFAGMAAALACCRPAARLNHVLLAGAALLHCAVFLAYRDMEPNQVWFYFLYHYFKWVLPVLGLYAVLLLGCLLGRQRVIAIPLALVTVVALFAWRPELQAHPAGTRPAMRLSAHELRLPDGLGSVWDAVAVPAQGSFDAVFLLPDNLAVGDHLFHTPFDFRAFPRAGGLLLLPVRPLPSADSLIFFNPGVTLDQDSEPFAARQRLVFGLPCWIAPWRSDCHPDPLFPGPVLRIGDTVEFRDEGAEYRGEGWSTPEPVGCWTSGSNAELNFRVPDVDGRDVVMEIVGRGYAPPRSQPSRIAVLANDQQIADVQPSPVTGLLRIVIPAARFGPDGRMSVRLRIATPRRPADFGRNGDRRHLGLLVQSLLVVHAN